LAVRERFQKNSLGFPVADRLWSAIWQPTVQGGLVSQPASVDVVGFPSVRQEWRLISGC
jgi:hypothetical protein